VRRRKPAERLDATDPIDPASPKSLPHGAAREPVLLAGSAAPLCFCVLRTRFGWLAVVGRERVVELVTIGHATRRDAVEEVRRRVAGGGSEPEELTEADWFPELRRRLERYAAGEPVGFDDVELNWAGLPEFSRRVLLQVRRIPFGQTRTYGQVAAAVGRPRAARAVGGVVARNRWPLLVPCHRVVAASGRLGGFSAPQGTRLKRRLLSMECRHDSARWT